MPGPIVAAHQATLSDQPLLLVHARLRPASLMLASGFVDPLDGVDPTGESQRVLDAAVELVRELAPGIPVSTCTGPAGPARMLLDEADRASMVVLGGHGADLISDVLIGTVCATVASRAPCPVVAVTGRPGWPDAPILVGLDRAATAAGALAVAFTLAQRRQASVAAASCATPACSRRRHSAGRRRALRLGRLRARHPGVVVELAESRGDPATELTTAAADAQLLVLGRAGHGVVAGLLTQSVAHALLRRPPCPLAIVPASG